jgi:fatty-acyl-CoA synthase
VYGVPDPVSGDQVMAALEIPEAGAFDNEEFARFLASQPDLGTKWAPRFVRVLVGLPVTGAGKLDKAPLRRAAWITSDPVWWRPDAVPSYRRFTDTDAGVLRERFGANGREGFWPGPA